MNKSHTICDKCNGTGKIKMYHLITENDINPRKIIFVGGKRFLSRMIFGGLESFDVGKYLILKDNILYIENQQQYDERVKNE